MLHTLKLRAVNVVRSCRLVTNRILTGIDTDAKSEVIAYEGQENIGGFDVVPMSDFVEPDKKYTVGIDKDKMEILGSDIIVMLGMEPDLIVTVGNHNSLADVIYANKYNSQDRLIRKEVEEDGCLHNAILSNTRQANAKNFSLEEFNFLGLNAWRAGLITNYAELRGGDYGFNNGQKICASCVIRLVCDRGMHAEKAVTLSQKPLQELVKISDDSELLERFNFYTNGGKLPTILNKKQEEEVQELVSNELLVNMFNCKLIGDFNGYKRMIKAIEEQLNS